MATIYVDSNATGANDGTSFADAFTAFASAVPAIGDTILVASDHLEDVSGSYVVGLVGNLVGYIEIVSVDSTTELYEAGARINNTNANIDVDNCVVRGMTLNPENIRDIQPDKAVFVDCEIICDTFGAVGFCKLINTTITAGSSVSVLNNPDSTVQMYGGSITASNLSTGDSFIDMFNNSGTVELFGVDLSGVGAEFILSRDDDEPRATRVRLFGCRLPSSFTRIEQGQSSDVELINCISGTSTDPIIAYAYENDEGSCELDTAVTRTGGASDGTTSYTMELTAKADRTFKSSLGAISHATGVSQWVEPGDTNLRIYIAHDAVGSGASGALQDDECWAIYQGPSELATADAQLALIDTRTAENTAVADLTTDASSWSGTGVGTVQRIDIPIDPTEAGYAHVVLNLATGSASDVSIHFDPKLDVT